MTCFKEYILHKIIKSYTNQKKIKNETESNIKQAIKFIKNKRKDISRQK